MVSLKRTNQGGSVLTFIIIATVLAVAVIGTAYFVKQRGERVRDEQATVQADKIAKEKTDARKTDKAAESTTKDQDATTGTSVAPTSETPVSQPNEQVALPTTGPEMDVMSTIAVGLLVASVSAYVSSRRALNPSL